MLYKFKSKAAGDLIMMGPSGDEILRIDDQPEARQRQRLAELRQKRDDARVKSALEQLRTAAREHTNVVEPMLECVRAYATLYEIRRALEDVHGAYKEPIFF